MNSKVFARGKAGDTVWRKMLSVLSIILLTGLISLIGAPHAGTAFGPEKAWAAARPVPVLDPGDDWYQGTAAKSAFTTINIVDEYWPDGTELEYWDASVANNDSVGAYVSADGKTLTITGNGYGKIMANEYSRFLFRGFSSVTAINGTEILDVSNVTDFQSAFSGCSSLVALDLDNWNVENVVTMGNMFDGCSALTTFGSTELGSWDTSSLQVIGSAFYKCESLTKIDVSSWDMSSCTAYNHAFMGCESLVELDVSKWDTSAATEFIRLFYGCENLSVIDISNWDSTNVKRMGEMFSGCRAVTELDFSNFDTSNCVDMYALFWQCNSLTTLKGMDTLDTSKVEDFTYMFCGCRSLTSLDLSNFDTSACTDGFLGMFYNCYALEVLDISSFDMRNARDMNSVMEGCRSLRQISVGENFSFSGTNAERKFSFPTPDPTYIPGATGKWQAVGTGTIDAPAGAVYAPADVPEFVAETYVMPVLKTPILAYSNTWYTGSTPKSSFNAIHIVDSYAATGSEQESWDASKEKDGSVMAYVSADGKTLTIAGNGYGSIIANTNSQSAFEDFTNITTVTGIDLLDTSKVTTFNSLFMGCEKLTSIPGLNELDTSRVEDFDYAFRECLSLPSLDISSWSFASATSFFDFMSNCRAMKEVKLPEEAGPNIEDITQAFHACWSLESVDVSCFASGKIKYMNSLFQQCDSLVDLKGYETLVTPSTTQIYAAFNSCNALPSLDLSQWDTQNVTSMNLLFSQAFELTEVKGLENWDTSKSKSFARMFYECENLQLPNIQNWDVSASKSFEQTFFRCYKFTELDLSAWKTDAATDMAGTFSELTNLKTLNIAQFNTSQVTDMERFFGSLYRLQQVTLGENFSFTGNGSTFCVLPTPSSAYIPEATGNWQAVGKGTVAAPAGTIYAPADVPSNVAETYVMPIAVLSVDVPIKVTLAASSDGTWCTPTATSNQIINHSIAPVSVVAAKATPANDFTLLAANSVANSTKSNVFGGTIKAGAGAAQDLTSINTSAAAWTMAAKTAANNNDLISLQLAGSVGNVNGTYFTEAAQLFGITYTFELAL